MWILDAHLDLSMNGMEWNRDLTQSVHAIREREHGQTDRKDRASGTVSMPAMREGRIGICVATQIARYVKPTNNLQGWYTPEQAWAQTQGQLAWYRIMEEAGQLKQITDRDALNQHAELWANDPAPDAPIGYILTLEGADSLITPAFVERSHAQGLRAIGPAHYGPGTYAQGTGATGGLGSRGKELLAEMGRLGIILDATHLCDESFWEALDAFKGPVWASHNNCRALVPDGRQFSDEQIKALIDRDAVIGGVLDAWMLSPGWQKGVTTPAEAGVMLEHLVDHMDHICQLSGNARHIGIGTDLDGGYGLEQCPRDLDTITDLQRLPGMLTARGYSEEDIAGVMHGNFLHFLNNAWA